MVKSDTTLNYICIKCFLCSCGCCNQEKENIKHFVLLLGRRESSLHDFPVIRKYNAREGAVFCCGNERGLLSRN